MPQGGSQLHKITVLLLTTLTALMLVACGSGPPHYICSWDAERYIKRELVAFPATYDKHELDTTGVGLEIGKVTGNKEDGWVVESVILFGVENAYGVKQNYAFHYRASVDEDDNCGPITYLEFEPYQR